MSLSQKYNDVMVIFNPSVKDMIEFNDYIKLIIVFTSNKGGCIFTDYKQLTTTKKYNNITIKNMCDNMIVLSEKHNFKDGDIITFKNMKGTNVNFSDKKIKVISNDTISCDLNPDYKFINGMICKKTETYEYNHKHFREFIKENDISMYTDVNKDTPVLLLLSNIVSVELEKLNKKEGKLINQLYTYDFNYTKLDKKYNLCLLNYNMNIFNHINDFNYISTNTNNINSNTIIISGDKNYNNNINYSKLAENNDCIFITNEATIVPFKTNKYSDVVIPTIKKSYMECKVQHFSNCHGHTMEWTNNIINDMIIENKSLDITKFNTLQDIVNHSITLFESLFINMIKKIHSDFPQYHKNEDNTPFWTNGKIYPRVLEKNMDYIHSIVDIYSKMLNQSYSINDIKNDTKLVNKKLVILDKQDYINVAITICNCRNMNYYLEPVNTNDIMNYIFNKSIMDNIHMAVSLLQTYNYIYNNIYKISIDTEYNITESKCKEPDTIMICNKEINVWQKFIETNNISLQEFIDKWNKIFNTEINFIGAGQKVLYMDFMEDTKTNLNKNIDMLIENINELTISSEQYEDLPNITISL